MLLTNLALGVAALAAGEVAARLLLPMDADVRANTVAAARHSIDLMRPCAAIGAGPAVAGPAAQRRPDALRVFVVGESSGEMLADEMREILPALRIDESVELLNCAAAGAALEHVQRQTQEALEHDPDVIVLVFGHNLDLHYPNAISARLLQWLPWSWLAAAAAQAVEVAVGGSETPDERLARFAAWLDVLTSSVEPARRLVLATMTPNYWMPPARSDTSADELLTARYEYAAGERDAAIARLERSAGSDVSLLSSFVLARWLARDGRMSEATVWLERALDGDSGVPGTLIRRERARSETNRAIRKAASRPGVVLHDSEARMRSMAKFALPGWDLLRDECHLHEDHLMGEAIVVWRAVLSGTRFEDAKARLATFPTTFAIGEDAVTVVLGLLSQSPPQRAIATELASTAVEQWLLIESLTPQSTIRLLHSALLAPERLPTTTPRDRCLLVVGAADGMWSAGRKSEAMTFNAAARQLGCAESWIQLGVFRVAEGKQTEAVTAFDEAMRIAPRAKEARFYKQATLARPRRVAQDGSSR